MKWFAVVVALVAGCKSEHSEPPPKPSKPASKIGTAVAPGTVKRSHVETGYGVTVPEGADLAALKKVAPDAIELPLSKFFNDSQVFVATMGMKPEDADELKAAKTVLAVVGEGADGIQLAHDLAMKAQKLAEAAHGWVLDPDASVAYRAAEFVEHIPGDHPDVRKLTSVHAVGGDDEAQPFLDTAGLPRYGFPELYVAEVGKGQVGGTMSLINGAAQSLLERGDVGVGGELAVDYKALGWDTEILEGGTGRATFTTRWAREPDAHESDPLVIELVPAAGASPEAWAKTINDCFGAKPEQIVRLKDDDPELLAAAKQARSELGKLRAHFKDGIPFKEQLSVKAKFSNADGGVEWMWVSVVSFKGNVLAGTLENEPELVTSVKLGQKVKVQLSDVADYTHYLPDGTSVGGYSVEIFKKRGLMPSD